MDSPSQFPLSHSSPLSRSPHQKLGSGLGASKPWLPYATFFTSMVLHGLLLMAPLGSEPPSKATESEAKEEVPVDILSLQEFSAPESSPTAALATPPPVLPPLQPPSPSRAVVSVLPPQPREVVPKATTQPQTPQAPPQPAATPEPLPSVEPSPSPTFDPQPSRQQFLSGLGNLGVTDYTDSMGLPPAKLFRRPENLSFFFQPNSINGTQLQPLSQVRQARWIDKEPESVLENSLKKVYEPAGVTFEEQPDGYGGERFFVAKTPAGQPFLYISLVQLKGSTLLVIWNENPAIAPS